MGDMVTANRAIATVFDRSHTEFPAAKIELATEDDLDVALNAAVEGTAWSELAWQRREETLMFQKRDPSNSCRLPKSERFRWFRLLRKCRCRKKSREVRLCFRFAASK